MPNSHTPIVRRELYVAGSQLFHRYIVPMFTVNKQLFTPQQCSTRYRRVKWLSVLLLLLRCISSFMSFRLALTIKFYTPCRPFFYAGDKILCEIFNSNQYVNVPEYFFFNGNPMNYIHKIARERFLGFDFIRWCLPNKIIKNVSNWQLRL